jgi:hypothetical protein
MVINSHKPTARNSAGLWKFSPDSTPLAPMCWQGGGGGKDVQDTSGIDLPSVYVIAISKPAPKYTNKNYLKMKTALDSIPVGMSTVGNPALGPCREHQAFRV